MTVLEALVEALRGATRHAAGAEAPPVAVLWPDPEGEWRPLVAQLFASLPEFFNLGPYTPDQRQGPVIWLKCIVDRALPDVSPPAGAVPVLYLPGVSRQDLRAGDACPAEYQPIIELQFRGTTWHQRNGREWTVEAFLGSAQGLGLDIAADRQTEEALHRALPLLAAMPIEALRGRRLEAEDFDRLAVGDPPRDLLSWIGQPERFRASCDASRWSTFTDVCRREFGFDPELDGPDVAASNLAHGSGRWDDIWRRYAEAPQLYPGVVERLGAVQPKNLLVDHQRLPATNDAEERALEKALGELIALGHEAACSRVLALEREHDQRRAGVWARLGRSPLALALEPLSRLAQGATTVPAGESLDAFARDYAERGWCVDRALLDVLAQPLGSTQREIVDRVARWLYERWLEEGARRLQAIVAAGPGGVRERVNAYHADPETCFVFADGLRFDLGVRLGEMLETRELRVRLSHRLAPLPTVTPTAKPLATPVADAVGGVSSTETFMPGLGAEGRAADAGRLRDEMARRGFAVMERGETRIPAGETPRGWTEVGQIDELGHKMNARLVSQLVVELDAVAARVVQLLDAGWPSVTVVTDHGWLLLPGGLPKVTLPASVVESRWARCAAVRGASTPDVPTYAWHWDPQTMIAMPPGIGSFVAGLEYAHGGISPQECVVPVLVVERSAPAVRATIAEVKWRGMRCRVRVDANVAGLRIDLRRHRLREDSSVVSSAATLDDTGAASLVVDDTHEGAAMVVVVLDSAGKVIASEATTIGETA
jgi:hypothetical protein